MIEKYILNLLDPFTYFLSFLLFSGLSNAVFFFFIFFADSIEPVAQNFIYF